jgi:hypothetical protein
VLQPEAAAATYIDVTGHSTPDSTPLGSMNRARWAGEVASRKARIQAVNSKDRMYDEDERSGAADETVYPTRKTKTA